MIRAPISVAATSTLAMVRTAETRGFETADLLHAAGVAREHLDDPDARLPGSTVLGIWNALRQRTADPAMQLVAPGCLPFGAYRVIDYLVAASASVGDGVQCFARYFRLIAEAIDLTIDGAGDEARCLTIVMGDGSAVPPVYVDYVFAALVTRIRMKIRVGLQVARVELRQPEPPWSHAHADLFRAPVYFDTAADRLIFSAEEWRAPMDHADATLAQLMEEHARILAGRMPRAGSEFVGTVRKAIAANMANGASARAVSRALNVSIRTLQRKLVLAGTTYRDLSDAVRGQLAQEYLADPRVSIAEVALLLGFSEQASFNRAFRRWTKQSPGRWRRGRTGGSSANTAFPTLRERRST